MIKRNSFLNYIIMFVASSKPDITLHGSSQTIPKSGKTLAVQSSPNINVMNTQFEIDSVTSIGRLSSSVSKLAMKAVLDNSQKKDDEPQIIITHHAHSGMAKMSLQDFVSLGRGFKIQEKLDSPFQGVFPEGTLAQSFESSTDKIEKEISLLQDKMNSFPVSDEQVEMFKGIVERYRYGIYHLHSLIWSAYKGGKQEDLNKTIGVTNKLLADTQLEIAILLHKFGVTEILHPHYQQKIGGDLTEVQIREMFRIVHPTFKPFVYGSRQLAAGSKE